MGASGSGSVVAISNWADLQAHFLFMNNPRGANLLAPPAMPRFWKTPSANQPLLENPRQPRRSGAVAPRRAAGSPQIEWISLCVSDAGSR